jgi:hypothetical protein
MLNIFFTFFKHHVSAISAIIAILALAISIYNAFRRKTSDRQARIFCSIKEEPSSNGYVPSNKSKIIYDIYRQICQIQNIQCIPSFLFLSYQNDGNVNLYNVKIDVDIQIQKTEICNNIFVSESYHKYSRPLLEILEPGKSDKFLILNASSVPQCTIKVKITAKRNDVLIFSKYIKTFSINYNNLEIGRHTLNNQLSFNPSLGVISQNEESYGTR